MIVPSTSNLNVNISVPQQSGNEGNDIMYVSNCNKIPLGPDMDRIIN